MVHPQMFQPPSWIFHLPALRPSPPQIHTRLGHYQTHPTRGCCPQVTTLLNSVDIPASKAAAAEAALIQGQVDAQANAVRQAKAAAADGNGSSSGGGSSVEAAVAELKRLKQRLQVGAGS